MTAPLTRKADTMTQQTPQGAMIPTPRTLRDMEAEIRRRIDNDMRMRCLRCGNHQGLCQKHKTFTLVIELLDALLAAEGTPADGRLLHIAGLVNGYHNDDHALSAAETLAEIATVLGPPMDEARSAPPTAQSEVFRSACQMCGREWKDGKEATAQSEDRDLGASGAK